MKKSYTAHIEVEMNLPIEAETYHQAVVHTWRELIEMFGIARLERAKVFVSPNRRDEED